MATGRCWGVVQIFMVTFYFHGHIHTLFRVKTFQRKSRFLFQFFLHSALIINGRPLSDEFFNGFMLHKKTIVIFHINGQNDITVFTPNSNGPKAKQYKDTKVWEYDTFSPNMSLTWIHFTNIQESGTSVCKVPMAKHWHPTFGSRGWRRVLSYFAFCSRIAPSFSLWTQVLCAKMLHGGNFLWKKKKFSPKYTPIDL